MGVDIHSGRDVFVAEMLLCDLYLIIYKLSSIFTMLLGAAPFSVFPRWHPHMLFEKCVKVIYAAEMHFFTNFLKG